MRDIKFKFLLENKKTGEKIMSEAYSIESILAYYSMGEKIAEDLEEKHGCDGNCTTESVNFCECGTIFDDFEVTHKLQYTGLKDKTGKEIYEGDIVDPHGGNLKAVIWVDTGFKLMNYQLTAGFVDQFNHCSVVGNIHENEELIS